MQEQLEHAKLAFAQYELAIAIDYFTNYISAVQAEVDRIHAAMTERIDKISEQSKRYLEGLNTPADSAFFLDTVEKLEQAVPKMYGFYEQIAAAKTARAQAILCSGEDDTVLPDLACHAFYHQFGLDEFEALSLWDGQSCSAQAVIIMPPQSLADELYFANYYPILTAQAAHCMILSDPRLVDMLQSVLSSCAIIGIKKDQKISKIDPRFTLRMHAEMLPAYVARHGDIRLNKTFWNNIAGSPHCVVAINDWERYAPLLATIDKPVTVLTEASCEVNDYFPHAEHVTVKTGLSLLQQQKHFQSATHAVCSVGSELFMAAMCGCAVQTLAEQPLWQCYGASYCPLLPNLSIVTLN